jgi:hypothetical protein
MNCLDAETLAAWFDGGLKGAALEDVRAHVAACDRCQMLLGAMGRTRAASFAKASEPKPRRWLAWAIPLTAAATAIAVWVAIPEQRNVPVVTPATAPEEKREAPEVPPPAVPRAQRNAAPLTAPPARAAAPAATPPTAALQAPPAAAAPPPAERSASATLRAQPEARVLDQQQRAAAAPAAPGDARGNDAGASTQAPLAETITVTGETPQGALIATLCGPRWRSAPSDVTGALTAGSSPSPNVCWVVGAGGVVRRSTNGQTWQRIPFPEMTDLSGVQASDARSARVTTADGRSFTTSDGGMTWARQ